MDECQKLAVRLVGRNGRRRFDQRSKDHALLRPALNPAHRYRNTRAYTGSTRTSFGNGSGNTPWPILCRRLRHRPLSRFRSPPRAASLTLRCSRRIVKSQRGEEQRNGRCVLEDERVIAEWCESDAGMRRSGRIDGRNRSLWSRLDLINKNIKEGRLQEMFTRIVSSGMPPFNQNAKFEISRKRAKQIKMMMVATSGFRK